MPSAADVLDLLPPSLRGHAGLWVVGGAVRDVLLGRPIRELDLVVEGDALARSIGEVVAAHERFGTATVRVDGEVLDLASARRERYARPGTLPEVELGVSIEEDLRRRDFTVNAMAVSVADGRVVTVDGAAADVRAGVLRVLHTGSFVDDPTRLLRMARYAARLGFVAEVGTAALARSAVAGGALDTVTGARLGNEVVLLLGEPQPAAALALAEHGVGAALFGAPYAPDAGVVERAVALCPPDGRAGVAALAAALAPGWGGGGARWAGSSSDSDEISAHGASGAQWADSSSDSDEFSAHGESGARRADRSSDSDDVSAREERATALGARLRELALPARDRDVLLDAATGAGQLAVWLATPRRPSELWSRLRHTPVEAVAVAGALDSGATDAARRWLEELRHVRADVTGRDLLEHGVTGPAVGCGLDAALRARLDGEAPDRDTQLAIALAAATR